MAKPKDPFYQIDRNNLSELQLRRLERFPEKQRSIFELACIEGNSYKEIGDAMECSSSYARSCYNRIVRALKIIGEDEEKYGYRSVRHLDTVVSDTIITRLIYAKLDTMDKLHAYFSNGNNQIRGCNNEDIAILKKAAAEYDLREAAIQAMGLNGPNRLKELVITKDIEKSMSDLGHTVNSVVGNLNMVFEEALAKGDFGLKNPIGIYCEMLFGLGYTIDSHKCFYPKWLKETYYGEKHVLFEAAPNIYTTHNGYVGEPERYFKFFIAYIHGGYRVFYTKRPGTYPASFFEHVKPFEDVWLEFLEALTQVRLCGYFLTFAKKQKSIPFDKMITGIAHYPFIPITHPALYRKGIKYIYRKPENWIDFYTDTGCEITSIHDLVKEIPDLVNDPKWKVFSDVDHPYKTWYDITVELAYKYEHDDLGNQYDTREKFRQFIKSK